MPSQRPTVQATAITYELQSLGWKAFQDLCATVVGEVLGQTIEVFLPANDAGRDGAFQGTWKGVNGESLKGAFTIQCKFTGKRERLLKVSDIKDELGKAQKLAAKGLATNYILMTNYGVSGVVEEKLRKAFLQMEGIEKFLAFGHDWLTLKIQENPRLRMLVPRVYGLGDLSQILDQRAYDQAQDILFSMGEDLAKFVVTDAYRNAARALLKHGFVILLGEPAAGKSTIAAHLALGAIDNWDCFTLKVRNADEFAHHWNSHEPRQFFWIDDAFGPTQYQSERVDEWNQTFPHLLAAIRKGAKVLFTSHDYIFKAALEDLKTSAFPLLTSSQVVINVHGLGATEKEQILYNHIKLGNQPLSFRRQLRPHLPGVASNSKFLPEIARRLGDQFFTKNLLIGRSLTSATAIRNFVERPLGFLVDVLKSIDRESFGAIALVFMRGGILESPISFTKRDKTALSLLGASLGGVSAALSSLNGSLVKMTRSEGISAWTYKHPTMGDAFASVVAANPELLDIYLSGARIERLISEVVCGDVKIAGAKVIIPKNRYDNLIERLGALESRPLQSFLAYRCSDSFLKRYLEFHLETCRSISRPNSYLGGSAAVALLCRLHELELLPEAWRLRFVERVSDLAVETPDADFLSLQRIRTVFNEGEISEILLRVESELFPNLWETVDDWHGQYDQDDDPDEHFTLLVDALDTFRDEYPIKSEPRAAINGALRQIERIIDSIRDDEPEEVPENERSSDPFDGFASTLASSERSIFDDVDE